MTSKTTSYYFRFSDIVFADVVDIITYKHGQNINHFFNKINKYHKQGYWLCGYFAYELGYYLEPALSSLIVDRRSLIGGEPLAWIGVCREPSTSDSSPSTSDRIPLTIKAAVSYNTYKKRIRHIKQQLKCGNTYQVNYTYKMRFDFEGTPLALFNNLRIVQPTPYCAYIDTGAQQIISLSPELFFQVKGNTITCQPMKGTIERGLTRQQDELNKQTLQKSTKTRAENLMIVDLMRNDLGRICSRVTTPVLFEVEQHSTLHQMTSTIKGVLRPDINFQDILTALFPCGSVTGAPKIQTMKIIHELEKKPRGIYTGAIGYIAPTGDMLFSVAIRTITLAKGKGEMGVGGGIVYDSDPRSEYAESQLKADFLTAQPHDFCLIETLRWEKHKGYWLLKQHLHRLQQSCLYFAIPYAEQKLISSLTRAVAGLDTERVKVRLLLDKTGQICTQVDEIRPQSDKPRIKLHPIAIDPDNIFLYHKTTHRQIYYAINKENQAKGYFDTIFLNKKGQLTEGSYTNIFIQQNNMLYTPPVKCGLLPGTLREHLLSSGKAREKVLYPADLQTAGKIFIGNAVRGLIKVTL